MTNIPLQQTNSAKKPAISLILGIVCILIVCIIGLYPYGISSQWEVWMLLITLLITITGLILGIMGLKSPRRKLAIVGIILNIIGLGTSINLFLIILISST